MGSLFRQPKPPAPLDVGSVSQQARTQNTGNAFQQAAFNRVNQSDPFGNRLDYQQTGTDAQGNPIFSANQTLGQMGQDYASGLSGLGQKYFDAVDNRPDLSSNAAFDRAYGYASANMEPRLQRAEDAARNRLANQGFDPQSEAYRSQMADVALQANEARNNLVTGLQGQMFNQGLQNRAQQMNEYQPGMQFGNKVLTPEYVNPQGVNVANVDVPGLSNLAKNQEFQNYNAQMQNHSAMLGGLAKIAGSVLMAPMTGGTSLAGAIGSGIGSGLGKMFSGGGGGNGLPANYTNPYAEEGYNYSASPVTMGFKVGGN